MHGDNQRETFSSTSGRVFGGVGLAVGLAFVGSGLLEDPVGWGMVSTGVLLLALSWTVLLRPAVVVDADDLVLRGVASTVRVPLAAVQEIVVRQVLVVVAGDKRYTCAAVGRGRREMFREHTPRRAAGGMGGGIGGDGLSVADHPGASASYGDLVESRLRTLADEAAKRAGVRPGSAEQDTLGAGVRRSWGVPEVGALVVGVAAVVLAVVL